MKGKSTRTIKKRFRLDIEIKFSLRPIKKSRVVGH